MIGLPYDRKTLESGVELGPVSPIRLYFRTKENSRKRHKSWAVFPSATALPYDRKTLEAGIELGASSPLRLSFRTIGKLVKPI